MKKYITMWQLWAGVAILAAILIIKTNDLFIILPYVLLLLCPAIMLFMMKDHHKR